MRKSSGRSRCRQRHGLVLPHGRKKVTHSHRGNAASRSASEGLQAKARRHLESRQHKGANCTMTQYAWGSRQRRRQREHWMRSHRPTPKSTLRLRLESGTQSTLTRSQSPEVERSRDRTVSNTGPGNCASRHRFRRCQDCLTRKCVTAVQQWSASPVVPPLPRASTLHCDAMGSSGTGMGTSCI